VVVLLSVSCRVASLWRRGCARCRRRRARVGALRRRDASFFWRPQTSGQRRFFLIYSEDVRASALSMLSNDVERQKVHESIGVNRTQLMRW